MAGTFADTTRRLHALGPLVGVLTSSDGTILTTILAWTHTDAFALRRSSGNGAWINPS